MIRDDVLAQQHDDALGMGSHQDHSTGGAGINAVTIVVGHDEAGRACPDRLFDEAVEGAAKRHQARAFVLEHVPDRSILELGMRHSLGVSDALVFQPCVQLGQALYPGLGPKHLVAQIADLVFDLAFLPARGGRARHRFDQMVRAHLQEATVVAARLAHEDRFHRRLHVVVDAAPAGPAVKLERLVVSVEHQLLRLAKVDARNLYNRTRGMRLCDSFICAAFTVSGSP